MTVTLLTIVTVVRVYIVVVVAIVVTVRETAPVRTSDIGGETVLVLVH